jgi:putative hydrolase of the HAD superfamily
VARGVLFDSGGTLVRPRGGRWNPRFDFEDVVRRHHPGVSPAGLAAAIAGGDVFLRGCEGTPPRDEYHKLMLATLEIHAPTAELLAELDGPTELPVLEAYPETGAVLEELARRGAPMCVVSDTWLGLERLYEQVGLAHYFRAWVISEAVGCLKPDPRMYRAGADALGLSPSDCLFVDDSAALVRAAMELGYTGRHVARAGTLEKTGVPAIKDLWAVLDLVAA